jgi:FixJ family two-component response regulator
MTSEAVVYVVDDDEAVRRSLARLIRSVGLAVETFPSAKAFLDHPLDDRPCCLVLDLRLPGPSGLDLQTALANAQRSLPIVFITGHGNVPASVRAMKAGALDFLQKPFHDQDLLDAVQRGLGRSRAARAEGAERAALQRRVDLLTTRERQVLTLVVTGKLNKQIAAELGAAEKTIKVHRGRVMKKMQAESVADLVRMTQKVDLYQTKAPSPDSAASSRLPS